MKRPANWSAALTGILALTAALELFGPSDEAMIDSQAPTAFAVATAPPATEAMYAGTWQDTILARPLFRPDRKPLPATPEASVPMPRLTAIVMTGSGARAIFVADDGKPVVVALGDKVNGWDVLTIGPDNVVLAGSYRRKTLHPKFANPAVASPANDSAPLTLPPRHFLDNQ
jgi:hypothetical protein